ncbi:MAG: TolB family protein [Thermoleophilaceae bacterium]
MAMLAAAAPAGATFPGRNGLVAYGAEDGLHVMRPDGTHDRIVSHKPHATGAAWGPSGNRIAFSASGRIYVANLRTGKTESFIAFGTDSSPTWSSKGTRIAFIRDVAGERQVWYVRLSDKLRDELIPGNVSDVEYAPDGSSIAYSSSDGDVYLAKPNGHASHKLVDFPEGDGQPLAGQLSWASDASELAVDTEANAGMCEGCEKLYTVNADGSGLKRITSTGIADPFYSPDGRQLRYCSFSYAGARFEPDAHQQVLVFHGEHYGGPTCGESWQARP